MCLWNRWGDRGVTAVHLRRRRLQQAHRAGNRVEYEGDKRRNILLGKTARREQAQAVPALDRILDLLRERLEPKADRRDLPGCFPCGLGHHRSTLAMRAWRGGDNMIPSPREAATSSAGTAMRAISARVPGLSGTWPE